MIGTGNVNSERRHRLQDLKLLLPPLQFPNVSLFFGHHERLVFASSSVRTLADLEKLAVIGQGSSSTVYKVQHRKSKAFYALKVLHLHPSTAASMPMVEAEILEMLDSRFIVKCHAVFENSNYDYCFVMELMERGSLYDSLNARISLPENVISGIAARVLQGLHYLQGMRIVHGDIKPSNLLINSEGDVKIADFGISSIGVGNYDAVRARMGTCAYMSPERVDPERWGYGGDGFFGDIWSLGMVVLECFVGYHPLLGRGEKRDWASIVYEICFTEAIEIPTAASPDLRGFVERCLEKDWRNRGTVQELLRHPFVDKGCL